MIHPTADVQTSQIGEQTRVWQFCVILEKAIIGNYCNICANVLIENDVKIGDYVTVKSGVQLWDGAKIEDHVFIGPNVTFTNDLYPRSGNKEYQCKGITLRKGCSIGANTTLIAGIEIGEYAMIGAGSVVTKNIPPYTLWYGNPAKHKGYVTQNGVILDLEYKDKNGVLHNLNQI